MKICIIIPAYNEEKRIKETLEDYLRFFNKLKHLEFKILVVLNGCTDGTLEIVKNIEGINHLDFKQNGKGFAILEGFKEALKEDWELIGFVDADNSVNPGDFNNLIENIYGFDGIIGSRNIKGKIAKRKLMRKIASRVFNHLVRKKFGLNFYDTQCGAKIFKRNVIEKIINNLGKSQWAFDIELLNECKKNNFNIKEFPIEWEESKNSKLKLWKASSQMWKEINKLKDGMAKK